MTVGVAGVYSGDYSGKNLHPADMQTQSNYATQTPRLYKRERLLGLVGVASASELMYTINSFTAACFTADPRSADPDGHSAGGTRCGGLPRPTYPWDQAPEADVPTALGCSASSPATPLSPCAWSIPIDMVPLSPSVRLLFG